MSYRRPRNAISRFLSRLGPGLITGCADDDPSGIATYSIAGAQFGYGPLWTALLSMPLMISVQMMCGRLGMVTGSGLATAIRARYPRWVLWGACLLLIIANVINIAADLGGMGAGAEMVTGIKSAVWILLATLIVIGFLFWSSYRRIAQVFKWTTLVLTAYIGAAFFAHVDWPAVALATVYPRIAWTRDYFAVLVAILGTTISPYLFFWQAAQEVEEGRAKNGQTGRRKWATVHNLQLLGTDVAVGMFMSNLIMYFVILTTAATLHTHGITQIQTARQAAEALRPMAGSTAALLFAFGLFGTGMLGVPVLAGSSAYTLTEAAAWRGSLEKKPPGARGFYAILAASVVIGLVLNYAGIPAMKMMFWSAVINGALAPPLILLIILLTNDSGVMGTRVNSTLLRFGGWSTFGLMSLATVGMLITMGS